MRIEDVGRMFSREVIAHPGSIQMFAHFQLCQESFIPTTVWGVGVQGVGCRVIGRQVYGVECLPCLYPPKCLPRLYPPKSERRSPREKTPQTLARMKSDVEWARSAGHAGAAWPEGG